MDFFYMMLVVALLIVAVCLGFGIRPQSAPAQLLGPCLQGPRQKIANVRIPLALAIAWIEGRRIYRGVGFPFERLGIWTTANPKTTMLWVLSFAFAT
jgi:hypothetical protein